MWDLVCLELLIAALLALSCVRPFVKRFRGIDGFALVPALAALLSFALFPAFGFRPEALPLALYAVVAFFASLPRLFAVLRSLRTDDYGEGSLPATGVALTLLLIVTAIAVRFVPIADPSRIEAAETFTLRDEGKDRTLFLRAYGSGTGKALLLVVPPLTGSIGSVDRICVLLAERGFQVLTFSSPSEDLPAYDAGGRMVFPSPRLLLRAGITSLWGSRYLYAQRMGTAIEDGRLGDIRFILSELNRSASALPADLKGKPFYIAAWGAGAAAATRYAAEENAASLRGLVAVEGPILSALEGEDSGSAGAEPAPVNAAARLAARLGALFPHPVAGIGAVPELRVPTLFLVSDQALDEGQRDGRYATVIRALRLARAPAALVALEGAGPFDYSEIGEKYPLYRQLFPSLSPGRSGARLDATADLIANFVSLFGWSEAAAESAGPAAAEGPAEAPSAPGVRITIDAVALMETTGPWNSLSAEGIIGR